MEVWYSRFLKLQNSDKRDILPVFAAQVDTEFGPGIPEMPDGIFTFRNQFGIKSQGKKLG
jgi:hypothetical protein